MRKENITPFSLSLFPSLSNFYSLFYSLFPSLSYTLTLCFTLSHIISLSLSPVFVSMWCSLTIFFLPTLVNDVFSLHPNTLSFLFFSATLFHLSYKMSHITLGWGEGLGMGTIVIKWNIGCVSKIGPIRDTYFLWLPFSVLVEITLYLNSYVLLVSNMYWCWDQW